MLEQVQSILSAYVLAACSLVVFYDIIHHVIEFDFAGKFLRDGGRSFLLGPRPTCDSAVPAAEDSSSGSDRASRCATTCMQYFDVEQIADVQT